MNKRLQTILYILSDYITASASWACFFVFRKLYIEIGQEGVHAPIEFNDTFYKGLILIPFFWLLLYAITGYYKSPFRKSRLIELGQTISITFIGVIILFFALLLDDFINSYKAYYQSFLSLFFIHLFITYFFRFCITTNTVRKIQSRRIGFSTLMIGSNTNALNLYNEMQSQSKSSGNKFIGFVHIENKNGKGHLLKEQLPHLGEFSDLKNIITQNNVEEVIVAIESWEHEFIGKIINELQEYSTIIIKVIPDMYDILSGSVKMNSIFGAPLIEISHHIMPTWQQVAKRVIDVSVSLIVLILFSPLYIVIAILVKSGSKGPALYNHERIGIHGKPFNIYKFRSMYIDAEKNGPALSSKTDPRITPFGKFMRKVRLDEIPQFYNVLIGDMSIVGPRPERQYYIDLIVKQAPHYRHLLKVRPGITSWGQVKYGYAETVEEMVQRLKYDVLYIENMSILVDFKILIYTVLIVVQGRGK